MSQDKLAILEMVYDRDIISTYVDIKLHGINENENIFYDTIPIESYDATFTIYCSLIIEKNDLGYTRWIVTIPMVDLAEVI